MCLGSDGALRLYEQGLPGDGILCLRCCLVLLAQPKEQTARDVFKKLRVIR